jgi:hypothetical protein
MGGWPGGLVGGSAAFEALEPSVLSPSDWTRGCERWTAARRWARFPPVMPL